ncbi:MAG: hypothetical protein SV375_11365 [Thermodesulfobacteriota bacterium]|nr:hypothetical protein [Thermodesulfobacteriota bacterium]
MKAEILALKGKIQEAKLKLTEFETKADGLIISIRMLLNPYDDISSLKIHTAKVQMYDLFCCWEEIRALKSQITKMERDLG